MTNPLIASELDRVWIGGAYLVIGDALARHGYFDRAPELELIRHVRNGIGHGNRFRIDDPSKLAKFFAHNRLAHVRGGTVLEIGPSLQGREVLFDFAGPADFARRADVSGSLLGAHGGGRPSTHIAARDGIFTASSKLSERAVP